MKTKTQKQSTQQNQQPWGLSTCIDLYACDPLLIRSEASIKQFVAELITLIDMQAYGPCHVVHFGQDPKVSGFSMFQLIETSCISGHFANLTNTAYLDVFSCKPYDIEIASAFCQNYFKASKMMVHANKRW